MQSYKLYLFDFDGTLVDSLNSLIDVFTLSFKAIGIEIEDKNVLQYTRQPLEETYTSLNAPIEKVGEFEKAIRYYLNDLDVLKKTELFPDTLPLINYMMEHNIKFGIVTSNNEKHVIDVLNLFNIDPSLFVIFVDSDKVRETKPSPKPLLYALEQLEIKDKTEVAYVGDAINDMISANRAGIDAILVDRTNQFKESNDYIRINNLLELFK